MDLEQQKTTSEKVTTTPKIGSPVNIRNDREDLILYHLHPIPKIVLSLYTAGPILYFHNKTLLCWAPLNPETTRGPELAKRKPGWSFRRLETWYCWGLLLEYPRPDKPPNPNKLGGHPQKLWPTRPEGVHCPPKTFRLVLYTSVADIRFLFSHICSR